VTEVSYEFKTFLVTSVFSSRIVQNHTRLRCYSYCDWRLSATNRRNSKAHMQPARWFSQSRCHKTANRKWPTIWAR